MQFLKQSTTATVTVGPVLDADGVAVSTAVLADFSIAKNGSVAVLTGATVTHSTNGYYTIALTVSNTDSLGRLDIIVNNSAMSMSNHRYDVIVAQVYDSVVSGSDLLQVDVTQLNGSTQNADRILIGSNSNRTVMVTGSNHVAADVHEFQTDVIDADAIAASAVTEIQAGLATTTQLTTVEGKIDTLDNYVDTEVAAIKAKTDNLPSDPADASDITAAFTEIKGAGWSSSTDTLEKIRDATGSGGGDSIIVTPVVAQTPVRAVATTITTFKGDKSAITVGVFDELDPVDLSALGALEVCIQTKAGTDLQLIAAGNITISGTDSNYFSFSPNSTAVGTVGRFMWSLRVASSSSKRVITYGAFVVEDAALAD
jgi:hypothetical protein